MRCRYRRKSYATCTQNHRNHLTLQDPKGPDYHSKPIHLVWTTFLDKEWIPRSRRRFRKKRKKMSDLLDELDSSNNDWKVVEDIHEDKIEKKQQPSANDG
ncbi:hypothetical protein B9Z55_023118 [Caenorhabditis nigoni]|uniref:Uncharacterized protein n=1 Tax=Caenorhabditis nigoni TaxID=1611254 RepID=A0A2G5SNH2_9PELO|nr:hypothetical protein B9Z55_023118 [Caenorhabditis nigoni]